MFDNALQENNVTSLAALRYTKRMDNWTAHGLDPQTELFRFKEEEYPNDCISGFLSLGCQYRDYSQGGGSTRMLLR